MRTNKRRVVRIITKATSYERQTNTFIRKKRNIQNVIKWIKAREQKWKKHAEWMKKSYQKYA